MGPGPCLIQHMYCAFVCPSPFAVCLFTLLSAAVRCSVCSKRWALCRVATHGQNDNCMQFKGRLAHCPRCNHVTHQDQQVAIRLSLHNAVLEYGVASGERPAYLKPEDKAAWQWQVSEVKAGRY